MALQQTITCDACGIVKREANHWFTYLDEAGHVTFFPWAEDDFRAHNHLCSECCCMTMLSRKLANWSRRVAA